MVSQKGSRMEIRKATMDDLEEMMGIYAHARKFMAEHGNAGQWKDGYPSAKRISQDITEGKSHVCMDKGHIAAVFYFAKEEDPTYAVIEDGAWKDPSPYAVVHRIASAEGSKGAATFSLNWAYTRAGHLRIDTHERNIPMQSLLKKLGFVHCGTIYLSDGRPRLGFEKVSAAKATQGRNE